MEVDGKKGAKASRFSTLRVFKFSKNPPPPPPKDAVYLAAGNRSLASLSPESNPGSPLSADQYAASASAVSLALPNSPKRKRSGLFKFASVSKKSAENSPVPQDQDDENISMPWNFQHNVHVDEAFAGLPPSWTTSLQEAGFSDDEIAAIQQRRLADRPRDRSHSPAVLRPVPRSTSLPKSRHTPASSLSASSASVSSASSSPVPELPRDSPKQQPSPESSLPVYVEQPRPLNLRQREPRQPPPQLYSEPEPVYDSPQSQYLSRQSSLSRSPSPPPSPKAASPLQLRSPSPSRSPSPPEPDRRTAINPKNLTLDLALGDSAGSWSDDVLSATPWSADAGSPMFTVTAPPKPEPEHQAPALNELGSPTLGDEAYSPTAAYYNIDSPGSSQLAYATGGSYLGLTPSPSPSPTAQTFGLLPTTRERENRDSGMSDSTMLGVPASAGIVKNVSIARRAVANVVAANPAPNVNISTAALAAPPASPQSSNFGSSGSGSSESQDHQTPTTELADDEEDGKLDYYLEGKNYLEGNGYRLDRRPQSAEYTEEEEENRRRREWEEMQHATESKQRRPDARARSMVSATDTFGGVAEDEEEVEMGDGEGAVPSPRGPPEYESPQRSPLRDNGEPEEDEEEEDEEGTLGPKQRAALGLASAPPPRPTVVTTTTTRPGLSPGPLTALGLSQTPITPVQRYAGWVAAAVAPLEDFIDEPVDPRDFYCDLQEIAEGESGSVFAAALSPGASVSKLKLPPLIKARDAEDVAAGRRVMVAIKSVALDPAGTPKLADVQRECQLLRGLWCEQVLGLDALYVDLVDDALWIRMELMERSLADVVGLVDAGLRIQEPRVLARFASDMLQALDCLQKQRIAHRDLRSDNLLLNSEGVLKLTDFSNAVRVTPEEPLVTDPAGVVFWQAPEVRSGAYDPLKIDVWSVGATIWELAEASPPFADTQQPASRWPPVSQPALYPPSFHDFLRLCSEPAVSRPTPAALLATPFLQKACGRPVIVQLLSRCMAIEQALQTGDVPPTPL